LNVIDCAIQYASDHQVQMMFVASRNQVECAELATGYVEGFTSSKFVSYIRERSTQNKSNIVICRDHSGPYMLDTEAGLRPEIALDQCLTSIKSDIDAGFDLIHVDCSKYPEDIYQATAHLVRKSMCHAESVGRNILFEVGTEENIGVGSDYEKFSADLEMITQIVKPEFVVGQTGSLLKEAFQVGHLDYKSAQRLVGIAHSFGIKFKEHNGDYLSSFDLQQRNHVGVDAINVGPEFGALQTRTVIGLGQRFGFYKELDAFLNRSIESGKWRKWVYGPTSDILKAVIAGHYVFSSDEYHELVDKLQTEIEVNSVINEALTTSISHYVEGLG
jgi:hypothetical protein